MARPRRVIRSHVYLVVIVLVLGSWWGLKSRNQGEALIVYCTHDSIYAEAVLARFSELTGIRVQAVYDTEATKSLGLQERLRREGKTTPADVFWNNEMLGTIDLAHDDRFLSYQGPGWQRIPGTFRDDQGRWAGFGARLRVWIRNGSPEAGTSSTLFELPDLHRLAVAKPLYGTTLTQFSVMRRVWGAERLSMWWTQVRQRGLAVVDGNSATARLVASGAADAGWTDTDDFLGQKRGGAQVWSEPVEIEGRAILIPNTVAILACSRRPALARKLADFLLSPDAEDLLARSCGQIPLGREPLPLPDEVAAWRPWVDRSWDLRELLTDRNACVAWLKGEGP